MTRDSGFIDFLEVYLDEHEGQTPLPDEVRDVIRAELPSTHQRPAWWPGWRSPVMNTTARYVVSAAAAVIVVIVGFTVLSGNGNFGSPDPTPSPSSTPVAILAGQQDLAAGRYSIASGISLQVSAAVPNDWSAVGSWGFRGPQGYDPPRGTGLRFYTVGNLLNNPSDVNDGLQDPPVGPTVDDLVEAIADQSEWTSSTPTDTTIGGYPARHLRITVPDGAELDPRNGGSFFLFQDEGSGQIWGLAAGQMFEVYIVDVEGERLVLDAFHYPDTAEADFAELQAVVDSIQINAEP